MMFGKYDFRCRLTSEAVLPHYKGSTFRGVFGHALKKVVCALSRQECKTCLLRHNCVYALVFEARHALKPPAEMRAVSPPSPYVIEPDPTTRTRFSAGDSFDFSLMIFGELNNSLPYFIYAFEQMGKIGVGRSVNGRRGEFVLEEVKWGGGTIYSNGDGRLLAPEELPMLSLGENGSPGDAPFDLRLTLETPLRFKFNNKFAEDLTFNMLARAMLRRATSLLICYGDGMPGIAFHDLVDKAEKVGTRESSLKWYDWRRYSNHQEKSMLMGGMIGSVTYENIPPEFLRVVDFCAKVHLGKQTSFGLGKIKAEIL